MKRIILIVTWIIGLGICHAEETTYQNNPEFIALRDSMHHAFNDGDSARFFPVVKRLQDYVLAQNDVHAYYTHRCNEIVFLMNQQRIFEAYKLARQLSKELREKKVDKEMYMATNMLGHINRYCGNKAEAKKNWYDAIEQMKQEGYYANMPPIYMNIVNVALDDSPTEADSLLELAKNIAIVHSPERVFDIETRQTLSYYHRGDFDMFLEGYKAYKEGEKEGKSSVHGRTLEVYYLAYLGKTDEAIALAKEELGDEGKDAIVMILEKAGKWEEAFKALKEETEASDSIDNVVLINSMAGITDEIRLYDAQRETYRIRFIGLTAAILLLTLLIVALVYIVQSRRRHLKEMTKAYDRARESDKMKTALIQNVSHEVRTPLNIIGGFAQVIADPELTESVEERQHMAKMMQKSAHQITSLIDEMLGLSLTETTAEMRKDDVTNINDTLRDLIQEYENFIPQDITLDYQSTLSEDFRLMTNKNMFKRIISALLENAVKFTEKGKITIYAEQEDDHLRVAIEDTGCGIPANEAEHIFERFVKLNSFKEGIGLGLPLSRTLAEHMGGTLNLDTTYTKGARFVLKLPL